MAVFRAGHEHVSLVRSAHFIALEGSATYSVQIRDAFVPDDDVLSEDAGTFVTNIRKGFVLLQAGIGLGAARGAARSMREDSVGRRLGANLPLGPDEIDARCDELAAQVKALARDPQANQPRRISRRAARASRDLLARARGRPGGDAAVRCARISCRIRAGAAPARSAVRGARNAVGEAHPRRAGEGLTHFW